MEIHIFAIEQQGNCYRSLCSACSLTFNRSQQECRSHYIRTRDIRALLLDTIKAVSACAISNEAEFIVVHAPGRSSGERTQEADIYLEFIGKFDVPLPEPTPEELAEMEKLRQQRAYYREKSRPAREKKKLQEQKTA